MLANASKAAFRVMSHPSRVRGLKSGGAKHYYGTRGVAPFTGAWIEINILSRASTGISSRTLHGCVD